MLEGFAFCQTRKVRDASILKYSVVSWASCAFHFNICGVFVLVALSASKFLTWCRPCSRSYEWAGHMDRRQKYQRTALGQTFKICDTLSSIKHDLARSYFWSWPKIGNEGDKISRKKNWRGARPLISPLPTSCSQLKASLFSLNFNFLDRNSRYTEPSVPLK